MTRLRFTVVSCLIFASLGPLIALLAYVACLSADMQAIYLHGDGALFLLVFAYLSGVLQAVLYGALTCAGLLGVMRLCPCLVAGASPLRRVLVAQLTGLTVVMLLQGSLLVLRGKRMLSGDADFLTTLARIWELERSGTTLIGLVSFVAWYLLPAVICASLVGWFVLPRLIRPPASARP